MLKPLLFTLTIVTIIALALNFNFFSDSTQGQHTVLTPLKKEVLVQVLPEIVTPSIHITKHVVESNLSQELNYLLKEADLLLRHNKSSEALSLYEKVIEKSQNEHKPKILKLFAEACLIKAKIHSSYPSFDMDSAIESYELIVNKFKDSKNKALLLIYMQARMQQTLFNSKDEILIVYDELIQKFTNDKEKRFQKEIEELLFAKSFALMGVNDEEAIEVLDQIIAKYDKKSKLPETVKFSILNNIELSIITANDTDKYVDLANEYMSDSPDTKPLLDMLSIIKNAQDLEQNDAFEVWNKEHKNYNFPDWDFSELRKWVNTMERPAAQARIRQYLDAFERKKYMLYYPIANSTSKMNNSEHSDNSTQNNYADPYISDNEDGTQYEDILIYETDPYQND